MPEFKVYTRRSVPLSAEPFVTIQKKGIISINRAAFKLLDEPDWVQFLYDERAGIIGIRKVAEGTADAYAIRPVSIGASNYSISGRAFTLFIGIDTETAVRRTAYLEDGILCVNLNDPGTIVTGNRAAKSKSADPVARLPGMPNLGIAPDRFNTSNGAGDQERREAHNLPT